MSPAPCSLRCSACFRYSCSAFSMSVAALCKPLWNIVLISVVVIPIIGSNVGACSLRHILAAIEKIGAKETHDRNLIYFLSSSRLSGSMMMSCAMGVRLPVFYGM